MTESNVADNILRLATKTNLLAWIGILPPMEMTMMKMQLSGIQKVVNDDTILGDLKSQALDQLMKLNLTMNDGIMIILKKLDSDGCVKCGKCDQLHEILHMVIDDVDIHTIIPKIEKHYGDVSKVYGRGMPGEPGEGTPIIVQMLQMMMGSQDPEPVVDLTGSMSSIGQLIDKSKLH